MNVHNGNILQLPIVKGWCQDGNIPVLARSLKSSMVEQGDGKFGPQRLTPEILRTNQKIRPAIVLKNLTDQFILPLYRNYPHIHWKHRFDRQDTNFRASKFVDCRLQACKGQLIWQGGTVICNGETFICKAGTLICQKNENLQKRGHYMLMRTSLKPSYPRFTPWTQKLTYSNSWDKCNIWGGLWAFWAGGWLLPMKMNEGKKGDSFFCLLSFKSGTSCKILLLSRR